MNAAVKPGHDALPWTVYCDWESDRDTASWNLVVSLSSERQAWIEVGRRLDCGLHVRCIRRNGRVVYDVDAISALLRQASAAEACPA